MTTDEMRALKPGDRVTNEMTLTEKVTALARQTGMTRAEALARITGFRPPEGEAAPVAPTPKRGMNKLEARRAAELDVLTRAGDVRAWYYEGFTLQLADGVRYTPDFAVAWADGRVTFEETKGFLRDDARVKIRVAARTYPMFRFYLMYYRHGMWDVQEINP